MIRLPFWPRSRFLGRIDGIVERSVCGWIVDRKHPRRRVEVLHGRTGVLDHAVLADIYRADVQKAGLSEDGYCGFRIPFDGEAVQVRLSARHRPVSIDAQAGIRSRERTSDGSCVYAVAWREGRVWGYAIDREDPQRRRGVVLIDRDGERRHYIACLYDAEAETEGCGDGFHGFRMLFTTRALRLEDATSGFPIKIWR